MIPSYDLMLVVSFSVGHVHKSLLYPTETFALHACNSNEYDCCISLPQTVNPCIHLFSPKSIRVYCIQKI